MLISHHLFTATSIMDCDSIEREGVGVHVLLAFHEPVSKFVVVKKRTMSFDREPIVNYYKNSF